MKTLTIKIGVILLMTGKIVYAGTDLESPGMNSYASEAVINLKYLAPVTPKIATFDENLLPETTGSRLIVLDPSTPVVAAFDGIQPVTETTTDLIKKLMPKMPDTVDFSDSQMKEPIKIDLHPRTPSVADFE